MAKGKPSRAFLEALQNEKKRRGDDKPGGGFKTPEWFFNNGQPGENRPATPALAVPTVNKPAKRGYRYVWWHGVAAGAVLVTTIGIVMIVGRRGQAQPPVPQHSADAGTATHDRPVQSSALDVPSRPTGMTPPIPVPAPTPMATADLPAPTGRIVGMNYVVIQGYENDVRANEAADALRKAGIGCTVEKNHPYNPRLVLVIGTTPFAPGKTSGPEYKQYCAKIMQVSEKYAGRSKWKKFEPNGYKWR